MSLSAFPETIYGAIINAIETEAKQQGYNMVLSVIARRCVTPPGLGLSIRGTAWHYWSGITAV